MVSKNDGVMNAFIAIAACAILVYIVYAYNKSRTDGFDNGLLLDSVVVEQPEATEEGVENFHPVDYPRVQVAEAPADCFPKDRLTASDLLPHDAVNSQWAQSSPAGQGDVNDANYLTAGFLGGIDTIGSSLRIPSMDLRSTPLNPQVTVSVWNQSTVSPDLSRRPLEIGSC